MDNVLKPDPVKLDELLSYGPPYSQIAKAMRAHGVLELGDPDYREKDKRFRDKEGEVRASSLDLCWENRAARTILVRLLDETQLERFHRIEQREGWLCWMEIPKLFRKELNYDRNRWRLNDERMEAIKNFNEDHRPEMRKVFGVTVPPYFPLDNEFDGMEYHWAWDKSVRYANLILPEIKGSKRSAAQLLEEVA